MAGYIEGPWHVPLTLPWESRQGSMFETLYANGDSYLWLTRFIDFSMNRVRMLIHFGVIPYMVFDGDYLPSKALTEVERGKKRDESRKLGLELHRLGKPSQAHLELQKAVDVSPEMAKQLIEELKKLGVQYVVAPYEADAQLAYLERKGVIQAIISEDSDLLVFGAKCLLTKLDQYGDCVEINRNDFTACREISLVGWTDAEFRQMAILSGCDYLANINKMGLKTAYRLVRKYKTIEKILLMLQFDGQFHVPLGYLEAFKKAELTFLHQRVFCPSVNDIVMVTSLGLEDEPEDFAFIGATVDRDLAVGVAKGDLHPMTKEPIVVESTSRTLPRRQWGKSLKDALTTPSDLKPNKPIETFFKARRTPLAELDANRFTPSPSQQRLLQQENGPWSSTPAPAPPRLPRSSASMPLPAQSPRTGSLHTNGVVSASSAVNPQKRRRLCLAPGEEPQLPQPSTEGDIQRSRFFTPSVSDLGPLLKKNGKNRGKGKEVNVWSDDSVEDVMAELPDVSDCSVLGKTRKLRVFMDEENESKRDLPPALSRNKTTLSESSQSTIISTMTDSSSTSATTFSTSFTTTSSDDRVTSESLLLSQKFSYQPAAEKCPPQRNGDAHKVKPMEYQELLRQGNSMNTSALNDPDSTPSISSIQNDQDTAKPAASLREVSSQPQPRPPLPKRDPIEHKVGPGDYPSLLQNKSKPLLLRQGSMTPLQRLGAGALNRSQSCVASLGSITSAVKQAAELPPDSSRKSAVSQTASIPKPVYDMSVKGSEDVMIPDSEGEAEDVVSGSDLEEPVETPKLDLGRFAFSG